MESFLQKVVENDVISKIVPFIGSQFYTVLHSLSLVSKGLLQCMMGNNDLWMQLVKSYCCCSKRYMRIQQAKPYFIASHWWFDMTRTLSCERKIKRQMGIAFAHRVMISDYAANHGNYESSSNNIALLPTDLAMGRMLEIFLYAESTNLLGSSSSECSRCACTINFEGMQSPLIRTSAWVFMGTQFPNQNIDKFRGPVSERLRLVNDLRSLLETPSDAVSVSSSGNTHSPVYWFTTKVVSRSLRPDVVSRHTVVLHREVIVGVRFTNHPHFLDTVARVAAASIVRSNQFHTWEQIFNPEFLSRNIHKHKPCWWKFWKR
jgi:hypothetical protein